jgi:hypothetical protein
MTLLEVVAAGQVRQEPRPLQTQPEVRGEREPHHQLLVRLLLTQAAAAAVAVLAEQLVDQAGQAVGVTEEKILPQQ